MTRFTSEFQPVERKKRGPDKRTLMLEAIMRNLLNADGSPIETKEEAERAFFAEVVRRSINSSDPASAQLMKEVLVRMAPLDKATLPMVEFPFRHDGTESQKIEDVQSAVATGILSVDMGNTMVNMIASGLKVKEITELAERLERIEEMLAKGDE